MGFKLLLLEWSTAEEWGSACLGIQRTDGAVSGKSSQPTVITGLPPCAEPGIWPPGMMTKTGEDSAVPEEGRPSRADITKTRYRR